MRFILRDYCRTEKDDFLLNVQDRIGFLSEAFPVYLEGKLVGWKIQPRFE